MTCEWRLEDGLLCLLKFPKALELAHLLLDLLLLLRLDEFDELQ